MNDQEMMAALAAENARLRQQRDEARREFEAVWKDWDNATAENRLMRPVVEAAEALVDDWAAYRATHGQRLIAAVDVWRAAKPGDTPGELVPGEDDEKVIITMSIQFPSSDGRHEIAQGMVTILAKDVDLAYPDVVMYKTEDLVRGVVERFRAHRWKSKVERCNLSAASDWPLTAGLVCRLEKGHEGQHVLDR